MTATLARLFCRGPSRRDLQDQIDYLSEALEQYRDEACTLRTLEEMAARHFSAPARPRSPRRDLTLVRP